MGGASQDVAEVQSAHSSDDNRSEIISWAKAELNVYLGKGEFTARRSCYGTATFPSGGA